VPDANPGRPWIQMHARGHVCALYDGDPARDDLVVAFVRSRGMLLENPYPRSPDEFLARR